MQLRILVGVVLTLAVNGVPRAAEAQTQCRASMKNEWLRKPAAWQDGAEVNGSLVQPVSRSVSTAEAMLEKRDAVALSPSSVVKFLGRANVPPSTGRRLRPYLVRAVFPTPAPTLKVRWSGNDLHVFAGGLGCFAFTKQPIVLFLDREPTSIYVMASAAL